MKRQQRIAAIHDISCVGKCSLTVALPIISAAGIEVSVIPTAVLSTHTGGFTGYTYRDLTDDLLAIAEHWQSLNLNLDALYTGFLGSLKQVDIIEKIFDMFKNGQNYIIVDPVMADNGKLYDVYDKKFPQSMKKLCKKADILIPNITEAALLLDTEYKDGPYTQSYITELLKGLSSFKAEYIVLTGVFFDDRKLGVAVYDCKTQSTEYVMAQRIEGFYHGTGDVFASSFIAAFLKGKGLKNSAQIAVDFTVQSILRTKNAATDKRYGVDFENGLKQFSDVLNDVL